MNDRILTWIAFLLTLSISMKMTQVDCTSIGRLKLHIVGNKSCFGPLGPNEADLYQTSVWKQAIHLKKLWETFATTKIALLFMALMSIPQICYD